MYGTKKKKGMRTNHNKEKIFFLFLVRFAAGEK